MPPAPHWIAALQEGPALTLWVMSAQLDILAKLQAPLPGTEADLGQMDRILQAALAPWAAGLPCPTQVVCIDIALPPSGAARQAPCAPLDNQAPAPQIGPSGQFLYLHVADIVQAAPPDRIGSAAITLAGALALTPDFDGIFCLLGPVTVWAHVSAGEIVSFQTMMSGRLMAHLADDPLLAPFLPKAAAPGDLGLAAVDLHHPGVAATFDAALAEAMSRPERVAARLWGLREGAPARNGARLAGWFLGIELAACRPYWLGQPVRLIAPPQADLLYQRALADQGVACQSLARDACALAGAAALWRLKG